MLEISSSDVVAEPFPHVAKQNFLSDEMFAGLKRDFPSNMTFSKQCEMFGKDGSRTGSGFDLYRGEPQYEYLLNNSRYWREFNEFINSDAFLDRFRSIFFDHLERIGLKIDLDASRIDPQYFEPRERLTEAATLSDRFHSIYKPLLDIFSRKKTTPLYTRLDIHRSAVGYAKKPHCDRPDRLCSLILYFTDAKEAGLHGGDLLIFKHKSRKQIERFERHPSADDVVQVARLSPKENMGVFFPCQNNSYHGVSQVTSQGVMRDFLYINISGRAKNLW